MIGRGGDYAAILGRLTAILGRQPLLPGWAYDGMILGIQEGTEACDAKASA